MRGVHVGASGRSGAVLGSSPHARGPCRQAVDHHLRSRIIPACAGSITLNDLQDVDFEDHPRMRGVHQDDSTPTGAVSGSSPHARGP